MGIPIHGFERVTIFAQHLRPYHISSQPFLPPFNPSSSLFFFPYSRAFSVQHHRHDPNRSDAHYQHYKHQRDHPTATLLLLSPLSPLLLLQTCIAMSMLRDRKVVSDRY